MLKFTWFNLFKSKKNCAQRQRHLHAPGTRDEAQPRFNLGGKLFLPYFIRDGDVRLCRNKRHARPRWIPATEPKARANYQYNVKYEILNQIHNHFNETIELSCLHILACLMRAEPNCCYRRDKSNRSNSCRHTHSASNLQQNIFAHVTNAICRRRFDDFNRCSTLCSEYSKKWTLQWMEEMQRINNPQSRRNYLRNRCGSQDRLK